MQFRLQTVMVMASISSIMWRASAASSTPRALVAVTPSPWSPSARLRSSRAKSSTAINNPSRRQRGLRSPRGTRLALAFQHSTAAFSSPRSRVSSPPFSSSAQRVFSTRLEASSGEAVGSKKPIPTILLAGFLGSGKTSTLKHLLENTSNIKIGTIVNDVASVNIDAKLISNSNAQNDANTVKGNLDSEGGVVELQNGCACCSLADELFTSIETLTKNGERELDAIVVELSGVADPSAVRENWEQAELQDHPATRLATLSRTVTLIDACTFGTDFMTWDSIGERDAWTEPGDDCAAARKVPELLAEQVEAADLLLVNKIDLAGAAQVGVASGVARGLNKEAAMLEVEFGRVDAEELLGRMLEAEGGGDDAAAKVADKKEEASCSKPQCTDASHSHDHKHEDAASSACSEPECTDTSHSHDHKHEAAASPSECNTPDCTDTSHSHSHADHVDDEAECKDAACTDTSHSHSHDHRASSKTSADQLGITSFVYRTSTPFHSPRLMALLNRWPVPIKDSLDFMAGTEGQEAEGDGEAAEEFRGVLRSKGFCWMAPSKWANTGANNDAWRHDTAMYWSHAGKHFGITSAGKWWGTLDKEQMKPYFPNNMEEYARILEEDWQSEEWGDRRQELVFIGSRLNEDDIRASLDRCLCTEDEMVSYRAQLKDFVDTTLAKASKDD